MRRASRNWNMLPIAWSACFQPFVFLHVPQSNPWAQTIIRSGRANGPPGQSGGHPGLVANQSKLFSSFVVITGLKRQTTFSILILSAKKMRTKTSFSSFHLTATPNKAMFYSRTLLCLRFSFHRTLHLSVLWLDPIRQMFTTNSGKHRCTVWGQGVHTLPSEITTLRVRRTCCLASPLQFHSMHQCFPNSPFSH